MKSSTTSMVLLPAGFQDMLPPRAARESRIIARLNRLFANHGYEHVRPPMVEFEKSLVSEANSTVAVQTFRILDPFSREIMGIRADMTTQIARIAASRLQNRPRPLRLCYSGQVLRVNGEGLYAERQLSQAGVELIGVDSVNADAEVVLLAIRTLKNLRIKEISVDFSVPGLSALLLQDAAIDDSAKQTLHELIEKKDITSLRLLDIPTPIKNSILELMQAAGSAKTALEVLDSIPLSQEAATMVARLSEVVRRVAEEEPRVTLTIDPLERRGFEYHTGISFSFFSAAISNELGRGGRYELHLIPNEPAAGFTFSINSIMRALPAVKQKDRVYVPEGESYNTVLVLQEQGYVTVQGLEKVKDTKAEAKRLECQYVYNKGKAVEIE